MSNEFSTVFTDQATNNNLVTAANMHFIMASLGCLGRNYLRSTYDSSANRRQLQLDGGMFVKMVIGGVHKVVKIDTDFVFDPQAYLDVGSTLASGKDYSVYIVNSAGGADLKVSLNATYPEGATADNSRRIGGFHTVCADINTPVAGHPLATFLAGDILPLSVWDLKIGPECTPGGMVRLLGPSDVWVDIYMQSGTGANTASLFGGTVTKNQSWDAHSEDLAAVGKRMLKDTEFTQAAMGTIPYRAVMGSADPITTGGEVNTDGKRIVSNIGVEDMCGCYWQWIDAGMAQQGSPGWANAVPAGQGQQYLPINAVFAGGSWGHAANAGPRCRVANVSRAVVSVDISSRGCARSVARI